MIVGFGRQHNAQGLWGTPCTWWEHGGSTGRIAGRMEDGIPSENGPLQAPKKSTSLIGKAIAYATATRLHLSVHSTAPPLRHQPGQPISSAECLMHGAAQASHRTAPRPTPPRPAVSVDVGAPSVAPAAHATRAGASGEADVNADGTHARMLTLQLGMPMYTRAL